MKIPKLDIHCILMIGVIVALIVNCSIHYRSPAYAAYKEGCSNLEKRYQTFTKQVRTEFVPLLSEVLSNKVYSVSNIYQNTSVPVSDNSGVQPLDFKYQVVQGLPAFEFYGFVYLEGDYFCGERIMSISPTAIITTNTKFIISAITSKTPNVQKL